MIASVRIAAPPDVVFPYFTDQALATKWIAERADLDPRPGGVFAVDVQGNPARGTFIEVDPPHRVVFTWGVEGEAGMPPGSTTVEVVLAADGDDTVVTLTHHDLPRGFPPVAPRRMERIPVPVGTGGRGGGLIRGRPPDAWRRSGAVTSLGAPETRTCYIFCRARP